MLFGKRRVVPALRRLQYVVSAAAFVGLWAVILLAARNVLFAPLPSSGPDAHRALWDWLTAESVEGTSPEEVARLARTLERELDQGRDLGGAIAVLDEAAQLRAQGRLVQLFGTLLLDKAEKYAARKGPDREAYLDRQMARFAAWELAGTMPGDTAVSTPLANVMASAGYAGTADWTPEQRSRLRSFAGAVQRRWLTQAAERLWQPGGNVAP